MAAEEPSAAEAEGRRDGAGKGRAEGEAGSPGTPSLAELERRAARLRADIQEHLKELRKR